MQTTMEVKCSHSKKEKILKNTINVKTWWLLEVGDISSIFCIIRWIQAVREPEEECDALDIKCLPKHIYLKVLVPGQWIPTTERWLDPEICHLINQLTNWLSHNLRVLLGGNKYFQKYGPLTGEGHWITRGMCVLYLVGYSSLDPRTLLVFCVP